MLRLSESNTGHANEPRRQPLSKAGVYTVYRAGKSVGTKSRLTGGNANRCQVDGSGRIGTEEIIW